MVEVGWWRCGARGWWGGGGAVMVEVMVMGVGVRRRWGGGGPSNGYESLDCLTVLHNSTVGLA